MDPCGSLCVFVTYLFLIYAYFVIVGVLIVPLMSDTVWGILNGAFFTLSIILCVASHLKASLSNPGYVTLSKVNLDFSDPRSLDNEQRMLDGLTVCVKCEIYRPIDSHHCRICKRCIRKRHHHCQWINNCVGELNQKFFLQFVVYIAFLAIYSIFFVMFSLINYPDDSFNNSSNHPSKRIYHSVFLVVECIVFGMFAFAILCEQINSIIDNDQNPVNNINNKAGIGTNGGSALQQTPSIQMPTVTSFQSHSTTSLPHLILNAGNLKRHYVYFRRVFRVDNPLLWLLPFEFGSMKYQKQSSQDNLV